MQTSRVAVVLSHFFHYPFRLVLRKCIINTVRQLGSLVLEVSQYAVRVCVVLGFFLQFSAFLKLGFLYFWIILLAGIFVNTNSTFSPLINRCSALLDAKSINVFQHWPLQTKHTQMSCIEIWFIADYFWFCTPAHVKLRWVLSKSEY